MTEPGVGCTVPEYITARSYAGFTALPAGVFVCALNPTCKMACCGPGVGVAARSRRTQPLVATVVLVDESAGYMYTKQPVGGCPPDPANVTDTNAPKPEFAVMLPETLMGVE